MEYAKKIYKLSEAAKMIGINPRTLTRWIDAGEVNVVIHNGRKYIRATEIKRLADEQ